MRISPDFEHNRSDWSIVVSLRELVHAHFLHQTMHRTTSDQSILWITRGANGKRLWICGDGIHLGWFSYTADRKDPYFALPVPDIFIDQLFELAQECGDVELFCNETEGTIIGRTTDGRYIATDHPRNVEFTEDDLPYLENPEKSHDAPVVAEVSTSDLGLFAEMILATPVHRTPRDHRLPPFVTVGLEGDTFSWTIDWTELEGPRLSGSVPARVKGALSTTFYPYHVARFLKFFDNPTDTKIFIDGPDAEFAYFAGDDWGMRVTLDRQHRAIWTPKLAAVLLESDVTFEEAPPRQIPSCLKFRIEGAECFASVHPSEDFPGETVRLTHIAARGVHETGTVLAVINRLNQQLLGATVELREGEVRVVVETDASNILDFHPHLRVFKAAVQSVSSNIEFLPLFA